MKFLVLVYLVGCASASVYEALDSASDEALEYFSYGLEVAPSLKEVFNLNVDQLDTIEYDLKYSLVDSVQEAFATVLRKIVDLIEKGKNLASDLLNFQAVIEKIKESGISFKALLEQLGNTLRERVTQFLVSLGLLKEYLDELTISNILEEAKNILIDRLNLLKVRNYLEEVFKKEDKTGKELIGAVNSLGRDGIQRVITFALNSEAEVYGIKELFDKVGGFLKERFQKLADWFKEAAQKGKELAQPAVEVLQDLARELLRKIQFMTGKAAQAALDAIRPFAHLLGNLFDKLVEAVAKLAGQEEAEL